MNFASVTATKPDREIFFYFRYLLVYFSDYNASNKGRLNTSKILVSFMKSIRLDSARIMEKVCEGLQRVGDRKTINNNSSFVPLDVEVVGTVKAGIDGQGLLISMTHWGEQNGDKMRDPDMLFIKCMLKSLRTGKVQVKYFPVTYRNDFVGADRVGCTFRNGEIHQIYLTAQKDMAYFANIWLRNIKEQQFPEAT